MILADAGFDVYLLNSRGMTYSQRHMSLTRNDPAFWKFTTHDIAKFDAPAAIDKILELNGEAKVFWVGHSQGTLVGFMMLAERPEYNSKAYTQMWGPHKIGSHIPYLNGATRLICPWFISSEFCKDFVGILAGPPAKSFNWTRVPLYVSNFFISTSTWNNSNRNLEYHFDASPEENLKRYGSVLAPLYNNSNINTDTYLFWSRSDWLITPQEIESWLMPKLRPGVTKGSFEVADYNHFDYTLVTD
ncbi:hypothetical protein PENTCL1PPCAC_14850, partial [Pristionchus entomophagus]